MSCSTLEESFAFEWDEHNTLHIARHNVTPKEAEEVFFDKKNALYEDPKHSVKEERFVLIGKTQRGRLLYQVFTRRGVRIRVLTSRDINKKEVYLYEKTT